MSQKKRIVLLGATGSIGQSTLEVLRKFPDQLQLVGIAANHNAQHLSAIAKEFNVPEITLFNEKAYTEAQKSNIFPQNTHLHTGHPGLIHLATLPNADIIVVALTGTLGLQPTLEAIKLGKTIALANKEILVMAGNIIMSTAKAHNALILPVDSEHNAIFQCLHHQDPKAVDSIILTASGGAFRNHSPEQLKTVTPQDALKHPTWSMGQKVTIDSATMANKGLELIEAHWLFNTPPEKLQVLIHPQSIIHSMVQFVDGSILAQLSPTSMTFPIQYCLLFPQRLPACRPPLDLSQHIHLELSPPDLQKYPCLGLAIQALKAGGLAPTVFNAANEVAVDAFLSHKIPFLNIPIVIDKTLELIFNQISTELSVIIETHNQATTIAKKLIDEFRYLS